MAVTSWRNRAWIAWSRRNCSGVRAISAWTSSTSVPMKYGMPQAE